MGYFRIRRKKNKQRNDIYMRRRWRRVQYLCNLFWSRWKREYLPTLQEKAKWNKVKRNLKVDDVVLVRDENAPRNNWPMGVVTRVEPDSKGLVRSVVLRTHTTELRRPVTLLFSKNMLEHKQFKNIAFTGSNS